MKLVTLPVGLIQTNCYLVRPDAGNLLYVIDPGGDASDIARAAAGFSCSRIAVLLTHAHVDHTTGLGETYRLLKPEFVYLRKPDVEMYRSPENSLLPYLGPAKDLPETVDSVPADAAADFEIIPLPGHTPGGSGFLFPGNPAALFSGDTIFAGSVGRTDLGGDPDVLLKSIRDRILPLADDIVIYPGHGPSTTVGCERKTNPYLRNPGYDQW